MKDEDASIRRVCALALSKMIDHHTADDARELAFDALDHAIATDGDAKVKESSKKALKAMRDQEMSLAVTRTPARLLG